MSQKCPKKEKSQKREPAVSEIGGYKGWQMWNLFKSDFQLGFVSHIWKVFWWVKKIFNTKAVCQSLRSVIPIYMFAMQASKLGLLRHPADRAQTSNGRGGGSFVISISGESLSKKRVKSSTDKTRWRFPSLADQPPVAQVCQLFSSPRRGKSGEDQMFESVKVKVWKHERLKKR